MVRHFRLPFDAVRPWTDEVAASRPGDEVLPEAQLVMDRAFTLDAPMDMVWPWFVQLGKQRSGWYLPRRVERLIPSRLRAIRSIDPDLQQLKVGDVIPDWGGPHATFKVIRLQAPTTLVHCSRRGHTNLSWAINLRALSASTTRVHLRLRLSSVRWRRLAETAGGLIDLLTIAGLAAGLDERVSEHTGR